MLGFPALHHLPEFAQAHVHVGDAIQPSRPLSSPSPPALSLQLKLLEGRVHTAYGLLDSILFL